MPTLLERLRSFANPATPRPTLTVVETDTNFYTGTSTAADLFRDRLDYDRLTILAEALRAWRTNPIARWIVQLTNVFILGTGMEWECTNKRSSKFLKEFWEHPLNQLALQLPKWLDEQTRSGDLFLLFSVDAAGMSYVRAVPSERIKEIQSKENDYQQETFFIQDDLNASPWPAYNPAEPQTTFMLHFPINQPVGCQFGESDLSPLLPWIGRLSTIVSDRVTLNHVRSMISFVMQGKFMDPASKQKRQREIELHPPKQGSVLVTDETEVWSVLSAKLDSSDAKEDILAVKKMIAVGVGVPLHYLAEPESSTRTTAEAAGTPTFKRFDDRQRQFKHTVLTILQIALAVRRHTDKSLPAAPEIVINAGDITERDNSLLSLAAARVEPALADLYDRKLIEEPEYLRIFYRMIGELLDEEKIPTSGLRKDINKPTGTGQIADQPTPEDQEPQEDTPE
ncbi:MAG: hypothetical protein A2X25_14430 [Chloroflexi bacterium GWB2_49_20]|nr:MAG: hypothetical protein A2X25_14430 [Chloroflexi bacterium GWB2_49_20]OGN77289.1 MAG: hypothetical protein A2X26_08815 [Chloroflexi bacterium GWC2_49_37]OGN84714.1 MAG: hypothetical protein A2X27_15290 [Chloroflexi bacterium GWD2_49_16]HBG75123.1 hypothetical protein [Anaerolineae bacterium]HCC78474.1 hypothetical protein [Anaerolineae bacterium]